MADSDMTFRGFTGLDENTYERIYDKYQMYCKRLDDLLGVEGSQERNKVTRSKKLFPDFILCVPTGDIINPMAYACLTCYRVFVSVKGVIEHRCLKELQKKKKRNEKKSIERILIVQGRN